MSVEINGFNGKVGLLSTEYFCLKKRRYLKMKKSDWTKKEALPFPNFTYIDVKWCYITGTISKS